MLNRVLAVATLLFCIWAVPSQGATAIAYSDVDNTYGWCAGYATAQAPGCAEEWCIKSGGTNCDLALVCDAGWNAIALADSDEAAGIGAACDSPSANYARIDALATCVVQSRAVCWLNSTFDGSGEEQSPDDNRAFNLTFFVQGLLKGQGYDPGSTDGEFGNRTRAAVRKFQADMGIEQTGEIDEDLFYMLLARNGGTPYLLAGMESIVAAFTADERALTFSVAPIPAPDRTMSEELAIRSTLVQRVMLSDFLMRNDSNCPIPARSVEAIDVSTRTWRVICEGGGDYTIVFAADDQSSTITDNTLAAATPAGEPEPGKNKGPREKTKG